MDTTDRTELTDLVYRYAALVDDRQLDRVAALFAEDGVLATAAPPHDLDPVVEHLGPADVADALAAVRALDATVHAITGILLAPGDGADRASGRVSCEAHHIRRREDGSPVDVVWGVVYRDGYVRSHGRWRFARREVHVQYVESRPLEAARTRGSDR